jgi:hypothetical protein
VNRQGFGRAGENGPDAEAADDEAENDGG